MNDLLNVLDMSEDEQKQAIIDLLDEETMEWYVDFEMHLADLAFRLRGEVKKITSWWDACQLVYECVARAEFDKDRGWKSETGIWFQDFAKPIHWIIAALIAKKKHDN